MDTIRHFFSTPCDHLNNTIVVTTAAALSWLQGRFGVFTALFVITAAVMLCDLLTRIYAAWVSPTEKVESAKVARGLRKKLGCCLLIFVGLLMDIGLEAATAAIGLTLDIDIIFSALIMAWLIVQELISNLENLAAAGIRMPALLLQALHNAEEQLEQAAGEHPAKSGPEQPEQSSRRTTGTVTSEQPAKSGPEQPEQSSR